VVQAASAARPAASGEAAGAGEVSRGRAEAARKRSRLGSNRARKVVIFWRIRRLKQRFSGRKLLAPRRSAPFVLQRQVAEPPGGPAVFEQHCWRALFSQLHSARRARRAPCVRPTRTRAAARAWPARPAPSRWPARRARRSAGRRRSPGRPTQSSPFTARRPRLQPTTVFQGRLVA
jgi:hypothetical protein